MAKDQSATNQLLYTWDEGLHWETVQISSEHIEIMNIITDPENSSQKFIVNGIKMDILSSSLEKTDFSNNGVIIYIDFSTLHQRLCEGVETPGEVESDYEFWSPSGSGDDKCLMGHRVYIGLLFFSLYLKVTYVRRKREAQCYNG